MEILPNTQFMVMCKKHGAPLVREAPLMVHPNTKALAVWVFNLSNMRCDEGDPTTSLGTECRAYWRILAAAGTELS